jgi:MerR family copper efflux transcriptional regulator
LTTVEERMSAEKLPQTMHIGEVAERTGLSLRTIRHYDEVGLLRPSARSEGGFRLYSVLDLERLLLIRRMKPLGFSLDEMIQLLAVVDARAGEGAGEGAGDGAGASGGETENQARLETFIREAETRRAALAHQLEMADEFVRLLRAQ